MKPKVYLVLRLIIAMILIQTLRFKFTAHPESVYIFSKIGLEPYGRIITGVFELIAGILILIPRTIWIGALLSFGLMGGAIFMHLTQLGIVVNNDSGLLFITAVVVLILSILVILENKNKIPLLKNYLNT
jgi:uncharacterized membrane protein YphA (DoxX/SURF4 family)